MQIFLAKPLPEETLLLEAEEARHCIKVLRHKVGDTLACVDGKGHYFEAQVTQANPDEVRAAIRETIPHWGEHSSHIRLAVSPLRLKDRFEWLLEKAVELGVNEIVPLLCERTYKYSSLKRIRLESILLSALKQSKRSFLPQLHEPQSIEQFLSSQQEGLLLMPYCESNTAINQYAEAIQNHSLITVLIGPEGDFTPREVQLVQQANGKPVSLGENRLRSETAVAFALSSIKFLKQY